MKNTARLLCSTPLATALFAAVCAVNLPAQSTTTPPPATTPTVQTDEPLKLSVFEVRPEDDTGYQAMNTTSGSRLATPLKDTAASISPFTPEFLSDIAATNVN